MENSPEISVVVPVYREEGNIRPFLERLRAQLGKTPREIIFCLDPSPDKTEEVILEERKGDPTIKLLKFSRQFGQPMATLAGLQYSKGDAAIVMDVDLQDPPELIPAMIQKWREGYDVVIPQRTQRKGDPWTKRLIVKVGYGIIDKIADVKIPPNTGDFRLMSRRAVEAVVKLKECHGFLRGMVGVVGYNQCLLPFDRPPRKHGETNYNPFTGSLKIGFNGIFCFSTAALRLSTQLGFLVAGGALFLTLIYLILKLLNFNIVWGNPTLVLLISFLGGVQLISTGILGEYIARIYEEVRQRPKFIIESSEGFE